MALISVDTGSSAWNRLTDKLDAFLRTRPDTPFLAMDLDIIRRKYADLRAWFPRTTMHYAVKANDAPAVLATLSACGASFEVGSRGELDQCLAQGIAADRIAFGHPIKKSADIAHAYASGVRCFGFDSEPELEKLAQHAPGAGVLCRLQTSSEHAEWSPSRKFGCVTEMALELLVRSRARGLDPLGVAFHVGSQQPDPSQWRQPLADAATLYRAAARRGITLSRINIGGGFPAQYRGCILPLDRYAGPIHRALADAFGVSCPTVMIQPGRALVAEAGVIQTEVVLVTRKDPAAPTRWVYLDVGKFGGLAETQDECIRYRMRTSRTGPTGPAILAGPTSDSLDILYEHTGYELPLALEAGDRIEILSAGAYTSSHASTFNGVPPLRLYCV
jgi:ornithine decarboxylase